MSPREDAGAKPTKERCSAYRLFFETGADGMLVTNLDRTVSDVNPAACRILGRSREELAGSMLDDLFDPSYPVLETAWEELRTRGSFFVSARLVRADGSGFWTEVSSVEGDNEIGVVLREVEERGEDGEAPQASGVEYRAMVEDSVDAMAIFDSNNTFRYANPAFERLMGYKLEELIGSFVPDVVHPEDLMRGAALVAEIQNNPGPTRVPGKFRYRHKDGHWVYLETTLNNLVDDPDVRGVVAICRDVTDRVRVEEKLKESERWFRTLIRNAPDMILVLEEDGAVRYASPSVERALGYHPEDLVGHVVRDYMHPEDLEEAEKAVARSNENPTAVGVPGPLVRFRHKDGSWRLIEGFLTNLLDDPGVRGLVFNSRDVTERLRVEEALKESEERYRALAENALDFVVVQKPDSILSYVSPSIKRLLGYEPEEVVGTGASDYIHPEDLEWAWPVFYKQLQTPGINETVRIRYRHKNGSWRWFESACNNQLDNPAVEGLVFNCREITEKLEAEEALRESEERFRALVENAQDFIALADENNVFRYASPSIERIMGYAPEELVGKVISDYIHPDDLQRTLKMVSETLPVPGAHDMGTIKYRHKDGSDVYLEVIVNNRLDDPALRGVVCNCRDVTDRVLIEERLKQSEERYRALVENAQDFVAVQRPDNTIGYMSPSIKRLLGYEVEELVGTSAIDYIHPDDLEWAWPVLHEMLEMPGSSKTVTIRYRHKDGSWRWFESAFSNQLDNPAVEGLVFNCRDITERVEAEEALRKSEERLARSNEELARSNAELERFAFFASHGLRSPLRGIAGRSEVLLEDHGDALDPEAREQLLSMRSSGRYLEQLVEDLLNLSRVAHAPLREEIVDLSALASKIAGNLREAEPGREVEFEIEEDLKAMGDPNLLEVVLENLIANAWKYTSKEERARIGFGATERGGNPAYFVRDDGVGFDEARAAELFEPFRRLHRASEFEGTGIGLATVEQIVLRHGGRVWAEGEMGKGATFYFTLGPKP